MEELVLDVEEELEELELDEEPPLEDELDVDVPGLLLKLYAANPATATSRIRTTATTALDTARRRLLLRTVKPY